MPRHASGYHHSRCEHRFLALAIGTHTSCARVMIRVRGHQQPVQKQGMWVIQYPGAVLLQPDPVLEPRIASTALLMATPCGWMLRTIDHHSSASPLLMIPK